MSSKRTRSAIVGVAYSPIVRHADRTIGAITADTCKAAVADAGLTLADIDGLSVYPVAARIGAGDKDGVDFVGAPFLAQALGLRDLNWSSSITNGTVVGSVVNAMHAVASGACKTVLVWRSMHNPPGKYGSFQATEVGGDAQFTVPYGYANNVMHFAFAYSQYMARYGATREHMATYVVNCRKNAAINPNAIHFGKPITREDYMKARMIAEPLSILDCDMPIDACGALVITSAERARDLRRPPAYLVGGVNGGYRYTHSPILELEAFQESGALFAKALWAQTGMGPRDMDFASLYDSFSMQVYPWLESLGFCAEGEAHEFVQGGRIALDGAFPVNPCGGGPGVGRLQGAALIIDAALQIQGRAGERQLQRANLAAVTTGTAVTGAGGVVLSREPL